MARRVVIDIEKCYDCPECTVACEFNYRQGNNNGAWRMQELAMYASICRRCEESPCTEACPEGAIDKNEDGILVRYLMRCTSCTTCTLACPFGCRYPEIVQYKTPNCDVCAERAHGRNPQCVGTCQPGALSVQDVDHDPAAGIFVIDDHLAVKAESWTKPEKKK